MNKPTGNVYIEIISHVAVDNNIVSTASSRDIAETRDSNVIGEINAVPSDITSNSVMIVNFGMS